MGFSIRIRDSSSTLLKEMTSLEGMNPSEKVNFIIMDWVRQQRIAKINQTQGKKEVNAEGGI